MKFTKNEKSWILYDWANSAYATIMLAAVFPIFFTSVCKAAGQSGDMWWGIGTSVSTAIVAILSPILGAFGDYKGLKKNLLTGFLMTGLVFTGLCAFVNSWQLMLIGYTISYIGFSGSCLFYDSFITDVTTPERMDKVSAWGYGMGYIGGSTIPFIASIALITFGENFGIDATMAVKISLLITVVWWGAFSIPLLKNCKQLYGSEIPDKNIVKNTLTSLKSCIISMTKNKGILFFIISYFFYIDGVNTVINMATAYGSALGLDSVGMILALLVTQVIAFPCAILFGKLSEKAGTIKMLISAIIIYFLICILGFIMGFGMEEGFLSLSQANIMFWVLAALVGTVQGGIQALSRSYFGKLVPKEKSNEYFGVFDIFGKFAAILGPMLYAVVKATTGRSSFAILAIILLFAIGLTSMLMGRKHYNKAEIKTPSKL